MIQQTRDGFVDFHTVGRMGQSLADLGHGFGRDCGITAHIFVLVLVQMRPAPIQPVGLVGLKVFTGFEFVIQLRLECGFHVLDLTLGDQAVFDQTLSIERQSGLMRLDLLIHDRVGEHGLIALVVTKPAVAEDVDDHVLVELLAELGRDLGGVNHGLGVITVHVEDRSLNHQRDIRGIGAGAAEMRRGGKADLVVHHDMHGAAGLVTAQTRQAEPFGHNTLTGKGRVTVQQDTHYGGAVLVFQLVLLGADLAQNDGVHRLKVAGVGGQRQVNAVSVKRPVAGGAEVIFHITRTIHILGLEAAALEFIEDGAIGLAHHVGQNVQTAPVRHPDYDITDTQRTAAFDDLLHRGDQGLTTVQTEPLGAHIFDVQEFLKALGLDHLVQDRLAAFLGERDFLAIAFDPLFQPSGLFGIGNMHVLQRKCAAIGAFHDIDDLPHRGHLKPQHVVDKDRPVHVGLGKAIGLGVQFGVVGCGAHPQRIQIGGQMAPDAVGPDQHQGPQAVQHRALDLVFADLNTLGGRLVLDLFARRLGVNLGPLARERPGQIIGWLLRPVIACPGWPLGLALNVRRGVAHGAKELDPSRIHGVGVFGVLRVKLLQIFGIMPLHKA